MSAAMLRWTAPTRSMRRFYRFEGQAPKAGLMAVFLSVSAFGSALAGSFEDGKVAYDRGDYTTALRLWSPLAEQGTTQAQYYLALMYATGRGVVRDPARARTIYRYCADAGNELCQNNLGTALLRGTGGPVDKVLAVRYFSLAAEKGQANSLTSLADCYENGIGVPVDLQKAVQLYTVAAKKGFHIAHLSLGSLYERGLGLPRNDVYAAMHYLLATRRVEGNEASYYRQEYDKAKARLDHLTGALSADQISRARFLADHWPDVAPASTEIPLGPGIAAQAGSGSLSNSALVSRLSAATALVIGRNSHGLVSGSAFWISPGLVVSNRHVVDDLIDGEVMVLRSGSSQYLRGVVVAKTANSDIGGADFAVIRVPLANGVVALPLSPSVGPLTDVVASGYPGFVVDDDTAFWRRVRSSDWTAPSIVITGGQVSSVQNPNGRAEILMHTAQIWRGSSGGPLVDRCGRVLGVNTYRFTDAMHQEQANYAVSSSALMSFLRDNGLPFQSVPGAC
jgi:S1-C subfamily serine protease